MASFLVSEMMMVCVQRTVQQNLFLNSVVNQFWPSRPLTGAILRENKAVYLEQCQTRSTVQVCGNSKRLECW